MKFVPALPCSFSMDLEQSVQTKQFNQGKQDQASSSRPKFVVGIPFIHNVC